MSFQYDGDTLPHSIPHTMNQPLLGQTVGPSQTFTGSSNYPAGPHTQNNNITTNSRELNDNFVLLSDSPTIPTTLHPFRDSRVVLGLMTIPALYWEFKAVLNMEFHSITENPMAVVATVGLGLSIFFSLYSLAIMLRILTIHRLITSYPTYSPTLVPSSLRSAQSIRKLIPFVASVAHFTACIFAFKILIQNENWDWESDENRQLAIFAVFHGLCFVVGCCATMSEFSSGWEWSRYHSQQRNPSLRTVHTENPANGNPAAANLSNAITQDYSSQAYVALSLTPRSNRTIDQSQYAINMPPGQNPHAPYEGYITSIDFNQIKPVVDLRNQPAQGHYGQYQQERAQPVTFDHKYM